LHSFSDIFIQKVLRMSQTLFEKLQLKDEKNLLIQGIPSSIEKQFVKLAFAKNVTPLLRVKKIDFALIFAINQRQLQSILGEVFPALHEEGKLWIAYPKAASKIASDLNRDCTWECICEQGFECVRTVPLDHVWTAIRFQRREPEPILNRIHVAEEVVGVKKRTQTLPEDMETLFTLHPKAKDFFGSLPAANRKEYVLWITGAKREDTRKRRLDATVEKLRAGKKTPTEK
jgi:hypothetical protein